MARVAAAAWLVACGGGEGEGATGSVSAPDAGAGVGDAGADAGADAGRWEPRTALPSPIQEVAVVALRGRVWVMGGLMPGGQTSALVHVLDVSTGVWTTTRPLPEPLHHVNAAVVGGRIWIVGALTGAAFVADGRAWVYDPGADTWSPLAAMPAGTERGASMVAAIGTKIHVAGGLRDGGAVADFSAYDTATNTWAVLPALPAARDHGMGGASASVFYAIGGRSAALGSHTARVDAFDVGTSSWTARASMPTSRAGAAIAPVGSGFVVMGGEGNAGAPGGMFDQTERYDPASDTWRSLTPMPRARHGTGAATVEGVVIVPGGGDRQGLAPTSSVEALVF